FRMDDGSPLSPDRLPTHNFFGSGDTFTLEALVNVPSITTANQEVDAGCGQLRARTLAPAGQVVTLHRTAAALGATA
ncbi:MAG: hypothetical protein H7Y61_05915, partial [Rhizobiales bacterium]|nr:hypothetical protein [Rhizobacter sp.]